MLDVLNMIYIDNLPDDIKTELERYISYISKIDGVLRIYLFGSYAKGEFTEYSDIDLLVIVRDDINTLKIMQNICRELRNGRVILDVIADTESEFNVLSMQDRVTIQREVKNTGVLVFG